MPEQTTKRSDQPLGPEVGDVVLEELARLADDGQLEVGITLYTGGTLISGILTSGKAFFEAEALRMQQARGPQETRGRLSEFFRSHAQQDYPSSGEADAEHEDKTPPVGFLHLKNARPFDAEGPYLREGVWWRGRIDSIDGFNFGFVNPEGPRQAGRHPRPQSG